MDDLSTYALLGIPDGVATALVLVSLSLVLAPWFGGSELGPLKVPTIGEQPGKVLKVVAPIAFVAAIAAFFPVWQSTVNATRTPEIPPDRLLKATPFRAHLEDCTLETCKVEFLLKGFDANDRLRFEHTASFLNWVTGDFVDTNFGTADTMYFKYDETTRFEVYCRLLDEADLRFGTSRELNWRPWNERDTPGYAVWLNCGDERFQAGIGIGVSIASRRVNEPPVK